MPVIKALHPPIIMLRSHRHRRLIHLAFHHPPAGPLHAPRAPPPHERAHARGPRERAHAHVVLGRLLRGQRVPGHHDRLALVRLIIIFTTSASANRGSLPLGSPLCWQCMNNLPSSMANLCASLKGAHVVAAAAQKAPSPTDRKLLGEKVIVGLPTSETLRSNSSSSGRFHEGLLH